MNEKPSFELALGTSKHDANLYYRNENAWEILPAFNTHPHKDLSTRIALALVSRDLMQNAGVLEQTPHITFYRPSTPNETLSDPRGSQRQFAPIHTTPVAIEAVYDTIRDLL